MSRTISILAALVVLATPAGIAFAQPTAPLPIAVERSTAGETRVGVGVGFGTLSVSETYYNTTTYRSEDVTLWSAAGGAVDIYVGWVLFGVEGADSTPSLELGYRLSTVFDDTGIVHAHELTGVFRMNSVIASLGLGVAGVTTWAAPGFDAPRFSFSGQVGFDVYRGLELDFDTGVMWGPGDGNPIKRFALLVGYTF